MEQKRSPGLKNARRKSKFNKNRRVDLFNSSVHGFVPAWSTTLQTLRPSLFCFTPTLVSLTVYSERLLWENASSEVEDSEFWISFPYVAFCFFFVVGVIRQN